MRNRITQYIPGFASGGPVDEYKVGMFNPGYLEQVSFVESWKKRKDFYRFSIAQEHLMAELNEGRDWWVVGTLERDIPELPRWKKPEGM